jgi:CRP/FNR family cyclic AMP-dependent transcriptional regulator
MSAPTLSKTDEPFANVFRQGYNGTLLMHSNVENRVTARLEFLKGLPLFADLGDDELTALAHDFVPRVFRQNEAIFYQGDPGQALYLIESGQVRIYVQDDQGQETSVILYSSGEIFGELAVIDGLPRSASAVAMEDTVVYIMSRERFREHLRKSPQLVFNFMNALSVRVRYTTRQVDSLTLLDVPQRLARKLLELAQQHGQVEAEGVRINLILTQSDLASLIGATRESINKAIGAFRKQGFILVKSNHITIIDPDALREMGS